MATSAELLHAIGCLGRTFPQFVQREIGRLTDEFVGSVKSFTNPLAKVGDLSLQALIAEVAALGQNDIMGDVAQVAGIVDQLAGIELSAMAPGAAAPTGNRVQDVLGLGASLGGRALVVAALVPETPFIIAQRIAETLVQLCALKLDNLGCLAKHIVQLANVMTVLGQMRGVVAGGLLVDLATAERSLAIATEEFVNSRRSVNGALAFDGNAFDRGRAALEVAVAALMPKVDIGHQSILGVASAPSAGAPLPAPFLTPANARLGLAVVSKLVYLIQEEVQAVRAQNDSITFYLLQLRAVVTNYRSTPAGQSVLALRLQAITTLVGRVQEIENELTAARLQDPTRASVPELLGWSVALRSVQALANRIRADELVEGAVDEAVDAALKLTYGGLLRALDGIDSMHVQKGVEDVTDLAAMCLGICTQAELLVGRLSDPAVDDSDLRTFQVLVAETAVKVDGRFGESAKATAEVAAACGPMVALSIVARASVDELLGAMAALGLDRGRDLLATGQFAELFGASVDDLSYLGSAISCLTGVLPGIDDAGLRRQVAAIREELLGRRINSLLSAADNVDFSGLRRTAAIKDEIAALQQNAQTVSSIVESLKGLATSLSLDVAGIDPLDHTELAADLGHLTVSAGGRLATAVVELSRPSAGVPVC